ncbi:MAG: HAD family hydrolase [Nitrospinales bacterium]
MHDTQNPDAFPEETRKLETLLDNRKGIILDFDGLIADSEPFHYRAYNEVFTKYGHPLDPDEYWVEFTSKGRGIAGEIERHNLKLDVEPVEIRRQKFALYSSFCESGAIKLFPEAVELVERLNTRYRVAVASGSWSHDIRAILEHAGAVHLFSIILGKESAPREKPQPDIFLEAAEKLALEPAQCLVVEDALKGLTAARQAGMPCIIIRNRLNQNINFDEADLVLPSLNRFVKLLERMR